jgi:hypothetical protein
MLSKKSQSKVVRHDFEPARMHIQGQRAKAEGKRLGVFGSASPIGFNRMCHDNEGDEERRNHGRDNLKHGTLPLRLHRRSSVKTQRFRMVSSIRRNRFVALR